MRCTASRPAFPEYNLSTANRWAVSFGKNDRSFAILMWCTGQVRAFRRTFGEAAPRGGFGALAFTRHIPPLPVPITCSVKGREKMVGEAAF